MLLLDNVLEHTMSSSQLIQLLGYSLHWRTKSCEVSKFCFTLSSDTSQKNLFKLTRDISDISTEHVSTSSMNRFIAISLYVLRLKYINRSPLAAMEDSRNNLGDGRIFDRNNEIALQAKYYFFKLPLRPFVPILRQTPKDVILLRERDILSKILDDTFFDRSVTRTSSSALKQADPILQPHMSSILIFKMHRTGSQI